MAIVKMNRLSLLAMQSDREELLRRLQRLGCVEIDEPALGDGSPDAPALNRPGGEGLAQARERHAAAEQALAVLKTASPEKGGMFRPRSPLSEAELFRPEAQEQALAAARAVLDAQRRMQALRGEENKLQAQRAALAPWLGLDLPLDTPSTRETAVWLGTVPVALSFEELERRLLAVGDLVEVVRSGADRELQYILILAHASVQEGTQEVLKEAGWAKANLREWTGTAAENDGRIAQRLAEITGELEACQLELLRLAQEREALRRLSDRAAQEVQREEARVRLVDTGSAFLLEGWLPAACWERVEALLEEYGCAWQVRDPQPEEYPQVPVQLKNSPLTRPLNLITEMYALPAYDGIDPNPIMAPFFILFYGIMMADMGYGLLMMLISLYVLKKARPPKGKGTHNFFVLLGLCGVSTTVVGALTGGFFGDLIPQLLTMLNPDSTFVWFWPPLFNPLEDTIMVLLGALALGCIQVLTGMMVDFVKKTKDGHLMDAIWDDGSWWVIFLGGGLALAGKGQVAGYPAVLLLGIAMLVVGSTRNAKGMGKLAALIGAVYSGSTGFFSDVMSYSRLMALMLAGSVIAQVFNTIGAIPGNVALFFFIALLGNTLNFALNLLGCFVHDLRLQCLEFFGRFYQDGGKPFRPLELDTKFVELVDEI